MILSASFVESDSQIIDLTHLSGDQIVEELTNLLILSEGIKNIANILGVDLSDLFKMSKLLELFSGDNLEKFAKGLESDSEKFNSLSKKQQILFWDMFINCLKNDRLISARKLFTNTLQYMTEKKYKVYFSANGNAKLIMLGKSKTATRTVGYINGHITCDCQLFTGNLSSAPGETGFCSHSATLELILENQR